MSKEIAGVFTHSYLGPEFKTHHVVKIESPQAEDIHLGEFLSEEGA
jgi:hypothetical protein